MAPLQIAIVGAGLIGRRHVEAVSRTSGTTVSAIVDPTDAARAFAQRTNVSWFPDLEGLIAQEPPDGLIVATPNQTHLSLGITALRANIPVLIEKPLADTTEAAQTLVDLSTKSGTPILVGHHRRHNPIVKAARRRITEGQLGEIVAVHGMCWLYKPDDYFQTAWRTQRGAGPVFINLIHDVDLMRHLVGEIVEVEAFQSNHTRGHEVEDTAAIILRFANGALGTLSVSDTIVGPWSWELTAAENPAYPATKQNCYFIGGTHGSLEVPASKIWSQDEPRSWWEPIDPSQDSIDLEDPLDTQISHFCEVINGTEEPLVSGLDGLRSLQIVSAIKASAERKIAVGVNSV